MRERRLLESARNSADCGGHVADDYFCRNSVGGAKTESRRPGSQNGPCAHGRVPASLEANSTVAIRHLFDPATAAVPPEDHAAVVVSIRPSFPMTSSMAPFRALMNVRSN